MYTKDTTGAGPFKKLMETMERYGLGVCNINGQGYDGCAAISGKYKGVQAIIKLSIEKAYSAHFYAH